jgi:hypothetical protein
LHHLDHPHRVGLQPAPERSALTWRQFLRTQAASVLAEHTDDYNGHRPHRALGHADRLGPPNHWPSRRREGLPDGIGSDFGRARHRA